MPIAIICPCSAKLRAADHLLGQRIQCPLCKSVHDVVAASNNGHRPAPLFTPTASADDVFAKSGFSSAERARLEKELEPGESLLWAKKPVMRSVLIRHVAISLGFYFNAIVMGIILAMTWTSGDALNIVFLGGIMVLSIVAGIAWPLAHRFRYQRTAYAVTNKRIFVWDRDWFLKARTTMYAPSDVAAATRKALSNKPDAVGDLIFGTEKTFQIGNFKLYRDHGIFFVDNLPGLEKLVREALIDPYTDALNR